MTEPRFIRVPESIAERHRVRAERKRERDARYNKKRPDRDRGTRGKIPMVLRKFIVWDGEGPQDTGYSLLGNSEGEEICYPHLRTRDCLDLLLDSAARHPNTIHIGFGFNYDVSCILWELPWRCLLMLRKFTRTRWREYEIEHIPRKWFWVRKGDISVKIFDVHSFFATSLVSALENWGIGPWSNSHASTGTDVSAHASVTSLQIVGPIPVPDVTQCVLMSERVMVELFKRLRSEFLWKDIESIRLYMRLELKYTKILIGKLREAFSDAEYVPKSWHGPGAIARMAFKRHGIYDCLTVCPPEVNLAARFAFIAGRFELVKAGKVNGKVYTADINSAYPYYCAQLPNLARGSWRQVTRYEPGKFGVYRIRYEGKPDIFGLYPLPYRDKRGMISWPHRVTGWYWNPEAALVAGDECATFLEGWVFDEDDATDRPFGFLVDYYRRRKDLQKTGNPAEYTFKLIINSVYGQLAQRAGWDKKNRLPPKTHQIEAAGWITSSCRAAVYTVAKACGDSLVSIDTDGVTSLNPFSLLTGSKELGEWKLEEFDDGIFWQSGIYTLKEGEEWTKAKTRGIPKGTYTAANLIDALESFQPLKLTKKVFISYGLALMGQRQNLNKWKEEPHEFVFGGGGKRQHIRRGPLARFRKHSCHSGDAVPGFPDLHRLALPPHFYGPFTNTDSQVHRLPWLDTAEDMNSKDVLDSYMLFDTENMDEEDEWAREYV